MTVNCLNGRHGVVAQQHVGEENRQDKEPLEYQLKMGELHARVLEKKKRSVIKNPVVSRLNYFFLQEDGYWSCPIFYTTPYFSAKSHAAFVTNVVNGLKPFAYFLRSKMHSHKRIGYFFLPSLKSKHRGCESTLKTSAQQREKNTVCFSLHYQGIV